MFCVTQSQLEYLESMALNWSQVSQMFGVSWTTIYQRIVELFNICLDKLVKKSRSQVRLCLRQIDPINTAPLDEGDIWPGDSNTVYPVQTHYGTLVSECTYLCNWLSPDNCKVCILLILFPR